MAFMIYASLSCLMEAFRKEKESQTACPKCGEGEEKTQGFEHSTIISLLKHDPILGFFFAPFPQPHSQFPHTRGTTEERQ